MVLKVTTFWNIASHNLIEVDWHLTAYWLHHYTLLMKAESTSETLVHFYDTAGGESCDLLTHQRENLKSHSCDTGHTITNNTFIQLTVMQMTRELHPLLPSEWTPTLGYGKGPFLDFLAQKFLCYTQLYITGILHLVLLIGSRKTER
jgi:hypothetical protein